MNKTFFAFLLLLFTIPLASAQSVSIGDYSTIVDSEVIVPINISEAESIAGGVVNVSFNPSIVSVEDVAAGDFDTPVPNVNNESGWIKLVAARFDAVNKTEAVLANIVFRGVSAGTTDFIIVYASLNNETGGLITPTISNGSITVNQAYIPRTITVNSSGGADYTSVQAAIDAANHGDTVEVYSGIYYENVKINKRIILRGISNDADMPVIDAGGSGNVVEVLNDDVILDGFKIQNGYTGIYITSKNNRISNNIVTAIVGKAGKNEVRGNPGGAGSDAFGIYLSDSTNNTLLHNSISGITGGRGGNGGNGWGWGDRSGSGGTGGISAGIYVANSTNNTLLCNTVSNIMGGNGGNGGIGTTGGAGGAGNTGTGIYLLTDSYGNDLQDNTISYVAGGDGGGGGTLGSTGGNGGMAVGGYLLNSDDNTATGNSIFNTSGGAGGMRYGNRGADGVALGVYLSLSGNNSLYCNDISNNTNYDAYDDAINQWDNGSVGNYYSSYIGTDADGDGIGDTPYSIPGGGSVDRYPLMQPRDIIPPIYDLTASVGSTWINWAWKNPDDGVFNHTMVYIDEGFTTNTSGTNYNLTNLLPGATHTISTRTVSTEGILSQTWTNDTATTIGELSGGLFIEVLEPAMYSAYPVGETIKFNATVMDSTGTLITSNVSVDVDLAGPNGASRHLILSNEGNNFVGSYNISNEDTRGLWTVNITAYNTTSSGQASIKVLFIGAYFIQPYTDSRSYMMGETANFTARVTKSGNIPLTDQNVSLNLSAYQFDGSTLVLEPVEMVFNETSGLFECSVDTGLLGSGIFSVVFSGNDTDGNTETGSLTIGVSEDFNITVSTDKAYYGRNEPANVCGLVEFTDGTPLSNTNVSLRIYLKGFMRSYTATTNETGCFNFTFQPFAAEAGDYTVMATATNIALQRTAENHFTIHGLYLAPPSGTLDMAESSSREIDFILYNLGETTLTGIAATVDDLNISDNVDAAIVTTVPGELQPSESAYITLNVSAGTPVPAEAAFLINVSTDQMSDETSELHVNLFSHSPVVIIEPDTIAVGMNRNQTAIKTVTISNIGYGVLHNLTLTQPSHDWMRITSNTSVGDLKPGENTSFDIHIHSYNVSLGTHHDTISIKSDNHETMMVDLTGSVTDLINGSLLFYVEDDLGQNISGANISLIDEVVYQEYTAITNSTGYALLSDLPSGRYIYEVSSTNTNTLSQLGSVVVEPMDHPKRVDIVLTSSFIDFEWDVIPSTIDDWYQIVLNMTFETDVPVPIIVAFPPYLEYDMDPGDVRSGTLTVANLGIVSLFDVSITSNINSNVQFIPIVSHIEELKPKSSVQIPYTIELADDASSCNGFTGRININGKYIHFINGEGVASYTGTTVPLVIKTPPCEQPDVGAGTITGRVTDASDDSPIDGARVVAGRYSTYTNGSGSYTLTNVRSGTYRITAYKDGYYPNSTTVRVTKDTTTTVDFRLTPITTGDITGIVTNASDGTLIKGARVVAGGCSDATDNSGSYTLSGVLTGTHTITASKRGYYTSSTTVMVTKDNTAVVNLQLTPIPETVVLTGSVSGVVTDDTGKPLPLALVVTNGGFDFTNISGSYTITGVPVGRNRVRASKIGYHSASKTVQVDEDRTTIVNFQLKKIIIPPIPLPDCECIDGTPPVIWVYKESNSWNLPIPPTTPSKMFVENCNEEGTIEFSDAWGATISLTSLWTSSLLANIGMSLLSAFDIPVEIWHNEFIPEQIDPNEKTMLDVENMGRFFSDMESFGITLPIPDIFGGALGFVYGPYPHDASRNCLKIIPLGGVEIKEGSINIVFPPGPPGTGTGGGPCPDPRPGPGPDPAPPWEPPVFTETIHEIVRLSISQNATMERDAFWAGLGIRNRMPDTNIENVGVSLHISDGNGSANDKFFIRTPRLEGISDIDGSGSISPLQLAKAQWLIIPKPGAGGVSGQTYNISADITYSVDGNNFRVTTEDVEILVNPQPQLILDYYLPSDVIGNRPFKLAVMATNDGYGTARNFSIETAQPVIYNPSGLMIDFEIIRSALQGEDRSDSLKINFGDLSPGESKLAWWEMVVSMDGTFTEFTGEYTHSSELGGMETSLIKELNTNIIHREIETGAVNYSFLVTPKDDETYYLLLDSDTGGSTPVSIANYTVVSGPTPGNPNMDITIEDLTGQWVIVSMEDPYDNTVPILKVIRDMDGSEIPFYNYWMRDGRILIVDHYVEGFDGKYTIIFPLIFDTTFKPNPNGYQFANFGSGNYSWEIFRTTYGADKVEFPNGTRRKTAETFYEEDYRDAGNRGNCFGMSASSLILYHNNLRSWDIAGRRFPPVGPVINPGRNRSLDLADVCVGGIPLPPDYNDNGLCDPEPREWGIFPPYIYTPTDWVEYYQPLRCSVACYADSMTYSGLRTVYYELKLRMGNPDKWKQDPMVIGYIIYNNTGASVGGHAVVPYRIEESEDTKTGKIFIYDSNHPNDKTRYISVNLTDWTGSYDNCHRLRSFQAISLSAVRSDPQMLDTESVTPLGHLLYTDAVGRHLGYHNGEFKDDIPNASRIVPFGQTEGHQFSETYCISNLQLKRELYGIDDGIATVSILRPNTLIVIDVQVSPGSVDELLVPVDGSSVEFISGEGTSLLSLLLDRERTDFARLASINVSGTESGSAIQLLFSDDLNKVGIINMGLQKGYTVHLEQIGLNHSSYRSPKPIVIEETSSAWFIPSNWNDIPNNPIVVEHDIGNDGTIDYTEILPSQDTTPPAGMANLHPIAGTTWLNWTWTNPSDPDFNHTEIYLDSVFRTITSAEHFNATNLTPETSYTISTRTVDTAGNINQTWVNDTATTLPASDTTPTIEFTYVPPYGSFDDLEGQVWNVTPADYKVAVYIYVSGWWTKPTFAEPLTPIQSDGSWTCDITTGGADQYATRIKAYLVPDGYIPPQIDGGQTLPEELDQNSVANVEVIRKPERHITFSGYNWTVKSSEMLVGPGPNYFSDSNQSVWIDEDGELHLKILKKDGKWYCAEVYTTESLGYGKYIFYVASRVDQLDKNVVAGLFTWDGEAPEYNYREIDIEFSRWGQAINDNAQYVVQPWNHPGNMYRFNMELNENYSTHIFNWSTDSIFFQSLHGHYSSPPNDSYIIESWNYTGDDIPPAGKENVRINLWLIFGDPPSDGQEAEMIIKRFEHIAPIDTTPPSSITNLQSTAGTTYLNFTWTDPPDPDFSHVMLYMDGILQTNVTKGVQHFNTTGLDPDTSYEIGTHTVDIAGNINETWINHTAMIVTSVFDTGSGTYPSIYGRHTGTIKTLHDVNISTMYTYPCAGTGGHSEYVRIYGNGVDVNGTWNGYLCDYHNITFPAQFTLLAGHTYNYTIETGSYPQMHHTRILKTPDGEITCAEFVDANGKRYDNRIPAFRLESS